MEKIDSVIAVFTDHQAAEAGIRKLLTAGFDIKSLSVVGKGYQTGENVVGFHNTDDRIRFWGLRGAFWSGLWALFFGGVFVTVPVVGNVVVLGYLATTAIAVIENTIAVGGLNALGAALHSIGAPKDSIIQYEVAVKADGFLVMAHGPADEMATAKSYLRTENPEHIDYHSNDANILSNLYKINSKVHNDRLCT